jgi:Fe2+ transport system protein FeoA
MKRKKYCRNPNFLDSNIIPLAMAKNGDKLIVRGYAGCRQSQMRLIHMGIKTGDPISVISNAGQGQMMISIDNSRIVLGRGISWKIMVEKIR